MVATVGDGGDDEGQGKPHDDGGQVGTHYYGTHHYRQHTGNLQGEGCWKVCPREMEGTQLGDPFAPRWYQEDFLDSGLEKLKEFQDLGLLESFTYLCSLGQVINGLSLNSLISKMRIKRVFEKIK